MTEVNHSRLFVEAPKPPEHELQRDCGFTSSQCIVRTSSALFSQFTPLVNDSLHRGVFNLLKCEIADVKPSMHAFCLPETATVFSLMI